MYVAGLCGILYAIGMQLSANSMQSQPDMLSELFSSKTRAEFFRILFGLSPEEFCGVPDKLFGFPSLRQTE